MEWSSYPDLSRFLLSPAGSLLNQFISSASPDDSFILLDGLNIIHNRAFLRSIVENLDSLHPILKTLPRSLGEYLFEGGSIDLALPSRRHKIGLVRSIFYTLHTQIPSHQRMILITSSVEFPDHTLVVSPNLVFVTIQGSRQYGQLNSDDELIVYLTYEFLTQYKSRRLLLLSGDRYTQWHHEFGLPPKEWLRLRDELNGVLIARGNQWSFSPGYSSDLLTFYR